MAEVAALRVAEAFQQDIGLGTARLDVQTRKKLEVGLGDFVEIKGRRSTAAIVSSAQDDDEGKNRVRAEAVVRRNAGVSIGDTVTVQRIEPPAADSISIAPIYSGSARMDLGPGLESFMAKALARRPLKSGDVFVVPGVFLQGGSLPFMVISTAPKGFVQVVSSTLVTIKEQTVSETEVESARRVTYDDVGGVMEVLKQVREIVETPLVHPEIYQYLGTEPPGGILLYGPPGTGKTQIARAIAGETGAHFVSIPGAKFMSGKITEEELSQKFEEAREKAPSVVFIDEVDAIAPRRDIAGTGEHERRVVALLLTLLDGMTGRGDVVVMGATNRIDSIDPALRRPGRFDREIPVGLPSPEGREEILRIHLRGVRFEGSDSEKDKLIKFVARYSDGFSAADLTAIVQEASLRAVRRFTENRGGDLSQLRLETTVLEGLTVKRDDFIEALLVYVPSSRRGPQF